MRIKRRERLVCRVRTLRCASGKRKRHIELRLSVEKWIRVGIRISDGTISRVINQAKAAAYDQAIVMQRLVGDANARGKVSIASLPQACALRSESEAREIVNLSDGQGIPVIRRAWSWTHLPAQTIGERQLWCYAPFIQSIDGSVIEHRSLRL